MHHALKVIAATNGVSRRINLLLQSQNIGTTWANNRSSVALDSAAAPDGTPTADTLIEDATTGQHYVTQTVATVAGQTYTLSSHFKAKERSVGLLVAGGTFRANFDLSTGSVFAVGAPIAYDMIALSDGWYRCWLTFTAGASTIVLQSMADDPAGFSYAGNGSSGIYVWGAQLRPGSVPGTYTPTTTDAIT